MIANVSARRLALVGGYPPPYGGCSVHVQRLRRAFDGPDWSVTVIDLYSSPRPDDRGVVRCGARPPFNVLRAIARLRRDAPRIAHFHVSAMRAFAIAGWPLLASLRRGTRALLTIHSGSFAAELRSAPAWRRLLVGSLVRRFDRIIAVSEAQRATLLALGVRPERLTVIPAFVPPEAVAGHASRAIDGLRAQAAHVVVASGYGMRHYGFHDLVDAVARLRARGLQVGLVLCWYHSYDEPYVATLKAALATIPHLTFRDLTAEQFAAVLRASDLYVRATDRDGDAVAIREAAFFGRPVVASDVVERPPGTRLYPLGDVNALADAIEACLNDPSLGRIERGNDGLAAIRDVYEQVSR